MRLFVYGYPGLYGGAGTELHHQIRCWRRMGVDVHIIPAMKGHENEPLRQEMIDLGVTIHEVNQFDVMTKDDAIINFCSKEFLRNLINIYQVTKRTIFVNCMTFLFDAEKLCHHEGLISFSLYQREGVREDHERKLTKDQLSTADFLTFSPYFDSSSLIYNPERNFEKTTIGRISRQDADKFAANTYYIYEGIVSRRWKRGVFLGYHPNLISKLGKNLQWIETYADQNFLSTKDFWNQVEFIVQPTDTTENLPRIGFEAMYSGVPLVVDDRGGWKTMIEHGISGALCKDQRDFIYWGSRLAYEPELRYAFAEKAKQRAEEISSYEVASKSWSKIFERVFNSNL